MGEAVARRSVKFILKDIINNETLPQSNQKNEQKKVIKKMPASK